MGTDGMTIFFGKAASVSRSATSIVRGSVRTYGNDVSGDINSERVDEERALIVAENGREYPVRITSAEPVLREGGEYALLLHRGAPVMIGGINTGRFIPIESHLDAEREPSPGNSLIYLSFPLIVASIFLTPFGAAVMYDDLSDERALYFFLGIAAFVFGITCIIYTRSLKKSWQSNFEKSLQDRIDLLSRHIDERQKKIAA